MSHIHSKLITKPMQQKNQQLANKAYNSVYTVHSKSIAFVE